MRDDLVFVSFFLFSAGGVVVVRTLRVSMVTVDGVIVRLRIMV